MSILDASVPALVVSGLHWLVPLLEAFLHANQPLAVLNTMIVSVLVSCLAHGRTIVAVNQQSGLVVLWMTGIGTILFWMFSIIVLHEAGVL